MARNVLISHDDSLEIDMDSDPCQHNDGVICEEA
jgi:hypothetical protein